MSDRQEFITWVQSVLRDAEIAVHNGDVEPAAIWSRSDPVTVLGAWMNASGQLELDELFAHLAENFSDCTSYEFELLEARGAETPPTRWASNTPPRPSTVCRARIPSA